VAGGFLYFAGNAGGDDKGMPTFDQMLKMMDKNGDGVITKDETRGTPLEPFFDNQDANGDGKLTRDEYEMITSFMSAGKNAALAVKPGGHGDVTTSHVVWKKTKGLPFVPSAVAYRGQYIMVKDGGMVTAYDGKTGDLVWQERAADAGRYYASPVAANGNLYFTSLEDGVVTVVKAGSAKSEVVAQNEKLGERVAATPAIADDTLYIRGASHLFAFRERR
jgi:outer membrane protein assembly factor BamB